MAEYTFICDNDNQGCGKVFVLKCGISEYDSKMESLKCPACKTNKNIHRYYQKDMVEVSNPHTLGSYAEKMTDKMSSDQKEHLKKKHYEYRESDKQLPEGMKRGKDVLKERKYGKQS